MDARMAARIDLRRTDDRRPFPQGADSSIDLRVARHGEPRRRTRGTSDRSR